ncbi:cell division protein FtsX [Rhodobacteraceae bacterium]|nr:cell division protein FtsX [Paracoccaceae bacterium]
MKLAKLLSRDATLNRVVPPSGFTAILTIVSSGVMAFLAIFTIAMALAAGDLASNWEAELAGTATVRITASPDTIDAQTDGVLAALAQTPGIISARRLELTEQLELLAPWFGTGLPLDQLSLPVLIDITETEEGPDRTGLEQRLAAEAPGAVYESHGRWRAPLVEAAGRLRGLGMTFLILIALVTGVTITLAASSALSANAQVVDVLRLVGAKDNWITSAFVLRFTLRAIIGAFAGMILGVITVALMPGGVETGILSGFGFQGAEWLWPLFVPFVAGLIAAAATYLTAARTLRTAL